MDAKTHYDLLIEENNDPFRDPPALRKHMESWDGQAFLDLMELDLSKTVLEIGVGTGRIAEKTARGCRHLTGIDISPKTIERAKENLQHCPKTLNSRARNDDIVEPDPALLSMAVSETQPSCVTMGQAVRRA